MGGASLFSKKGHQVTPAAAGLVRLGKTAASAAQAAGAAAVDAAASGAKLAESVRAAAAEQFQDVRLPDCIQLPDLTLPRLQFGEVRREDVQLPDVTLPRFNAGNVSIKEVQLPDITVPRFSLGSVTAKDMRLKAPGGGAGDGLRRLIRVAMFGLVGLAIAKEMSQPEDERQWHGRVAGVPYDFRPPTAQRFRDAFWSEHAGLVTPTPWGMGWTINFHELLRMAGAKAASSAPMRTESEASNTAI